MEDETLISSPMQLEQNLSQHIQMLYVAQLGHEPSHVSCQLIDKTITIVVDNPITQPERLLDESGKQEFAQQVRDNLHKALQPQLKVLIEEVVGVSVIQLMGESKLQTGLTTVIALLADKPKVSNFS